VARAARQSKAFFFEKGWPPAQRKTFVNLRLERWIRHSPGVSAQDFASGCNSD
jgi:hypothetical protein